MPWPSRPTLRSDRRSSAVVMSCCFMPKGSIGLPSNFKKPISSSDSSIFSGASRPRGLSSSPRFLQNYRISLGEIWSPATAYFKSASRPFRPTKSTCDWPFIVSIRTATKGNSLKRSARWISNRPAGFRLCRSKRSVFYSGKMPRPGCCFHKSILYPGKCVALRYPLA